MKYQLFKTDQLGRQYIKWYKTLDGAKRAAHKAIDDGHARASIFQNRSLIYQVVPQ